MSAHQAIADLVVAIHAAYVSFVVLGVPAIFLGAWRGWRFARNFWFRFIHVAMIGVVACEAVVGMVCPLTEWENRLRESAGQSAEQGSFVGRLAHRLIFVDLSSETLTVVYVAFAVVVIAMFVIISPRRPRIFSRR
jgi:hypothetical protein